MTRKGLQFTLPAPRPASNRLRARFVSRRFLAARGAGSVNCNRKSAKSARRLRSDGLQRMLGCPSLKELSHRHVGGIVYVDEFVCVIGKDSRELVNALLGVNRCQVGK